MGSLYVDFNESMCLVFEGYYLSSIIHLMTKFVNLVSQIYIVYVFIVLMTTVAHMFQVEYYFSDINLATTDLLMRSINKDPEGFGKSFSAQFLIKKNPNRQKLSFLDK